MDGYLKFFFFFLYILAPANLKSWVCPWCELVPLVSFCSLREIDFVICFSVTSNHTFQTVEFWREAEILSKLHHPNVVAFYGVVQDGPGGTLATVTEFMVNGSLRHVLLSKDR